MIVTAEDVISVFPRELEDHEQARLAVLLDASLSLVRAEFLRVGRDFDQELTTVSWLPVFAKRVLVSMVTAAILVGENVGIRSVTQTTGAITDSVTFADVSSADWGGVRLTDSQRRDLGLPVGAAPLGFSPRPEKWPEKVI